MQHTESNTMKHSQHTQTYTVEPQESKLEGIIIAIACIAVFAFWGVLLALGV
jgi:hypothetical protein